MITRPGSPQAWASTAVIMLENRKQFPPPYATLLPWCVLKDALF